MSVFSSRISLGRRLAFLLGLVFLGSWAGAQDSYAVISACFDTPPSSFHGPYGDDYEFDIVVENNTGSTQNNVEVEISNGSPQSMIEYHSFGSLTLDFGSLAPFQTKTETVRYELNNDISVAVLGITINGSSTSNDGCTSPLFQIYNENNTGYNTSYVWYTNLSPDTVSANVGVGQAIDISTLVTSGTHGINWNTLDVWSSPITPGPQYGTTNVNTGTQTITYTPNAGTGGQTDEFYYLICTNAISGGDGACAAEKITVNISADAAPVAVNDTVNNVEFDDPDPLTDIFVLDNDTDEDLDSVSITIESFPNYGTVSVVTVAGEDYLEYDRDVNSASANATSDSFTYSLTDSNSQTSNIATVTLNLEAPESDLGIVINNYSSPIVPGTSGYTYDVVLTNNGPDVAYGNSVVIYEDTGCFDNTSPLGSVSMNDLNSGQSQTITITTDVLGGATGTCNLDAAVDGTDSTDNTSGNDSATEIVSVDAAPVAVNDTVNNVEFDAPSDITDILVLDNDTDENLDTVTLNIVSNPTYGAASVISIAGEDYIEYDRDLSAGSATATTDSFTYSITDANGTTSNTATVTLNLESPESDLGIVINNYTSPLVPGTTGYTYDVVLTNNGPDVAYGNSVSITQDGTCFTGTSPVGVVNMNDLVSGGSQTITITTDVLAGASGTCNLDAAINGTDSTDSNATNDTANVSLSVNGNSAPTAVDDTPSTPYETTVDVDVTDNDTDPDGNLDDDSVTITSGPTPGSAGTASVVSVSGRDHVRFVPATGYTGTATIGYQVCDTGTPILCDTATITVTVNGPGNSAPTAVDDNESITVNTTVDVDVTDNDTDPDGNLDDDSVTITSGPTPGASGTASVVSVSSRDHVRFIPTTGYTGTVTIGYQVCDSGSPALCDTATITIVISAGGAEPDIQTTLTMTPTTAGTDEQVDFTIQLENVGTLNATAVSGTFDEDAATPGCVNPSAVSWGPVSVDVGQIVEITGFLIATGGTCTFVADATSVTPTESNTTNNDDSFTVTKEDEELEKTLVSITRGGSTIPNNSVLQTGDLLTYDIDKNFKGAATLYDVYEADEFDYDSSTAGGVVGPNTFDVDGDGVLEEYVELSTAVGSFTWTLTLEYIGP